MGTLHGEHFPSSQHRHWEVRSCLQELEHSSHLLCDKSAILLEKRGILSGHLPIKMPVPAVMLAFSAKVIVSTKALAFWTLSLQLGIQPV